MKRDQVCVEESGETQGGSSIRIHTSRREAVLCTSHRKGREPVSEKEEEHWCVAWGLQGDHAAQDEEVLSMWVTQALLRHEMMHAGTILS